MRTEGKWRQALRGPREQYVHYTIYYQGQLLGFRYVGPSPHPQFSWVQRLPGGRLLLGLRPTDSTQQIYAFHLFLLDAPGGQPRMQGLGRCAPENSLVSPLVPRVWFTPDSLGVRVSAADSALITQGPPYRFVDLRAVCTFTPLPQDPVRADSVPLEPYGVAWPPDHRLLARSYQSDPASERVLLQVFDRRTGRRQPARLFRAAATASRPPGSAPHRHARQQKALGRGR